MCIPPLWTGSDGGLWPFDPGRDATSLPLIRRALERGVPLLAICRGIQELNVALGGTLANEIQDTPGISDHRKPDVPDLDIAYGIRQNVIVKEGSCLASVLGAGEVQVNSLHRQAISRAAPRLAVEAVAEDGTIEAVSVIDARPLPSACNGTRNIGSARTRLPRPCSRHSAMPFAPMRRRKRRADGS